MTSLAVPEAGYAAALAEWPGLDDAVLGDLLRRHRPLEVWRQLRDGQGSGRQPGLFVGRPNPRAVWSELRGLDVGVTYPGHVGFPDRLLVDPRLPAVLYYRGSPLCLDGGCLDAGGVALVGVPGCSTYGAEAAFALGGDLARAGVCVLSGLGRGIEAAALEGALAAGANAAGPVAVLEGSIVGWAAPWRSELCARIARSGVVLSRTGPASAAPPRKTWVRNDLIAALSDAVVIVESNPTGPALSIIAAAADRGVPVFAAPGPHTQRASAAIDRLLCDGAIPFSRVEDLIAALDQGADPAWPPRSPPVAATATSSFLRTRPARPDPASRVQSAALLRTRAPVAAATAVVPVAATSTTTMIPPTALADLDETARQVLDAIGWAPTPTAAIADQVDVPAGRLSAILLRLERHGLIVGTGTWWQRCPA